MPLAKEWTDKKPPEQKEDFKKYILNSGALLDRLIEMIDRRITEVDKLTDADDFSSPSWALQMASRQGRRRALNEIRKLLERT